MDLTYQTYVGYLPATRRGLTPAHWSVTHLCSRCSDYVATADLVAHTHMHTVEPSGGEGFHSRDHSGTMAPKQLDPTEDPITASEDQHPPTTTEQRRR